MDQSKQLAKMEIWFYRVLIGHPVSLYKLRYGLGVL